ncbi:hypothetical protein [Chitinophaga arvensicola]|uniref:Outer membrane protein beta-barrel domain-containing protein n=1 Tax=Chitinophaga arvensicola TaxID=29529 RepID=A0A1I0Q5T0_9BACT|nr:hypothetical protein [Chitinophaga arvensicola]SEW22124.1 hypothetical protein SAMN04488122_1236 [Chitinophaga arvensicola]
MKCKLLPLCLLMLTLCCTVIAQDKKDSTNNSSAPDSTVREEKTVFSIIFGKYPKHREGVYVTHGGDGPLLSFASMKENGEHMRNIPRFTLFFNIGSNFNKDFSKNFGIFTGINLKNIGLISKPADSLKLKQRVYTLGVPVGFKLGDLSSGSLFFFAGGEIDLAFNYKEKQFVDGDKVHKFNEWFSDRTPLLMPSLFAGFRFNPGFGLKVQYYPQNFFNPDFKTKDKSGNAVYPNRNLEANLVFVTLGYNFSGVDYFKVKKKRHYMKMKSGKAEFEVNY